MHPRSKHLFIAIVGINLLFFGGTFATISSKMSSVLAVNPERISFVEPNDTYVVEVVKDTNQELDRNRFIERVRSTLPANLISVTDELKEEPQSVTPELPIDETVTVSNDIPPEPVVSEPVTAVQDVVPNIPPPLTTITEPITLPLGSLSTSTEDAYVETSTTTVNHVDTNI